MSKDRWDDRFAKATGQEAVVVRDPGLLASEVYPQPPRAPRERPLIGLGIMSHIAIRYHAETTLTEEGLARWYTDLARALIEMGFDVAAFTNGSPEDVTAAEALRPAFEALPRPVTITTPATPAELAGLVAGYDAVAAYRMHAIIAAHSFAVPTLALSWDSKLQAFMESVGRSDWLRDPANLPAGEAAQLLAQAASDGVDRAAQQAVVAEARADVGKLFGALTAAL
jgi:polysaccharide pyruvyl transferase WcaK-like protein